MSRVTPTDVLLYIPNLIGYARVVLMLASFAMAQHFWVASVVCYIGAFVGDVVDGYFARALKQNSNFGGVLDMVTDRVSTVGLLVTISHFYPKFVFIFILLIVIDIASHWFHVVSVKGHHKGSDTLKNRHMLLRLYYGVYPFFGYCCVGTEFFYILLYILHFTGNFTILSLGPLALKFGHVVFITCMPACVVKQIVNVAQLSSAAQALAADDAKGRNEEKLD